MSTIDLAAHAKKLHVSEEKLVETAHRLGNKPSEVKQIDDTPAGLRVVTADDVAYILTDAPDDNGVSVFLLDPPPRLVNGKLAPYAGNFPVFNQPSDRTPLTSGVAAEVAERDVTRQVADAMESPEAGRTAEDIQQEQAAGNADPGRTSDGVKPAKPRR